MKSYKDIKEEILNEGGYRYPGDDMTMKELKIAINAAKNILDMLEDGASIQRWQISAIVVASEELASVCTSMRADYDEEMEDEYENEVVAYEYPWMGEEVELDEENDYKVSVEGLPDMYVKANSPTEVKANLRKIVKKPDMVKSVDRVTQSVIKKIFRDKAAGKEDLDEAIDVRHDRYMRSHGKKASGGMGTWMFTHKNMGDVDYNNEKDVHMAPRGKFSDAAKSAKAWAKKHGHSTVYVMEEVELDEASIENLTKYRNNVSGPLADKRKEKLRDQIKKARDAEAKKIKKNLGLDEARVLDEASHYIKKIHTSKGPEWAVIPKGKVAPEEVFKSEKEAEKYIREKGSK